jgi:hypothetical protein
METTPNPPKAKRPLLAYTVIALVSAVIWYFLETPLGAGGLIIVAIAGMAMGGAFRRRGGHRRRCSTSMDFGRGSVTLSSIWR